MFGKIQKGFTIAEILISVAVVSILFGIVTINLLRTQSSTSSQTNIEKLVSDIKTQQTKAMTGATEGGSTSGNYGIYFLADQYVLFRGSSYNPSDSSNFAVNLPEDIEIQSTTLPGNTLIFSQLNGEMIGFSESANTITIRSLTSNEQKTVTLNRYGIITTIN